MGGAHKTARERGGVLPIVVSLQEQTVNQRGEMGGSTGLALRRRGAGEDTAPANHTKQDFGTVREQFGGGDDKFLKTETWHQQKQRKNQGPSRVKNTTAFVLRPL